MTNFTDLTARRSKMTGARYVLDRIRPGLVVMLVCSACANIVMAQINPEHLEFLPESEEITIALSAAPDHLRAGAGVHVLRRDGVQQNRASSNGFNCIINRDHPLSRKPTCYDAEGSATILPRVIRMSNMMARGVPIADIRDSIQEGFERGEFISPKRPGVAYMLSEHIRVFDPKSQQFGTFPPHIMFYAPNLTNADIGWTQEAAEKNPWLPSIGYQGPHGYMIVVPPDQTPATTSDQ